MSSRLSKHSLADTFTPQYLSLVRDYLAEHERVSVNVTVLGKTWSGRLGVIQRLAYDHEDCGPEMGDVGEDDKRIYLEGRPIKVKFCRSLGNDEPITESCHRYMVREADAILLVYDVAKRDTFEFAARIHSELLGLEERRGKPVWVCAARSHRPLGDWAVTVQEGVEFSQSVGARFLTASDRSGQGLDEYFVGHLVRTALLNRVLIHVAGPSRDVNLGPVQERLSILGRVGRRVRRVLGRNIK